VKIRSKRELKKGLRATWLNFFDSQNTDKQLIQIFFQKFSLKGIVVRICAYICTRFLEIQGDSVAQLVEQYTFNVWALGSNPSGITKMEEGKEGS
jgi:hypothetical protein